MKTDPQLIRRVALLTLLTLNATSAAVLAQSVTFTNMTFNAGSYPLYAAVADFNGDGKPDVVVEDYNPFGSSSVLVVLTNNGSGSFVTASEITTAPPILDEANCVVAADINGGGRPDAVCPNDSGAPPPYTLGIFTNNGSGSLVFDATRVYSSLAGSTPRYAAVADVNGDGKPDLISVDGPASTLTVFTNNGNGGFPASGTFSVGTSPIFVLAMDVNGDGKLDLITANSANNTLTVLTNCGGGIFGSNATLTAGPSPHSLAAADVNGDGLVDLICANNSTSTLMIFTNNGSGVFGSNATLTAGSGSRGVAVADVNGDGYPDLVSANYSANTVTVFTNNGAGIFSSNATFTVGSGPECALVADVNGDGKPDLITANYNDSTITVLFNTTPFPSLPPLKLTTVGDQFKLNWAAWVTNYVLESTTNLPASNWTTVTNGVSGIVGVTLTNTGPAQFFRLHQF